MKSIFQFITIALSAILISSCGNDDEDPNIGFDAETMNVLNIINGHSWFYSEYGSTTELTFNAFSSRKEIPLNMNNVPMKFDGTMKRVYSGTLEDETDFYFYIDTKKKEIKGYGIGSDPNTYIVSTSCAYSYEIVDEKTIKLKDYSVYNIYKRKD